MVFCELGAMRHPQPWVPESSGRIGMETRQGTTAGIDDCGALLIQTADSLERVVAGEVRWSAQARSPKPQADPWTDRPIDPLTTCS